MKIEEAYRKGSLATHKCYIEELHKHCPSLIHCSHAGTGLVKEAIRYTKIPLERRIKDLEAALTEIKEKGSRGACYEIAKAALEKKP